MDGRYLLIKTTNYNKDNIL